MEKINKLILCKLPNEVCNLKCEYCYISQINEWKNPSTLKYTPKYMAECLSKKRLGGTALINLTGEGETLLNPYIVDIVREFLLQGHFVEVVTNGLLFQKIEELLNLPEALVSRLFFKLSFHYKELLRLGKLDLFIDVVNMIKKSKASFTIELMAYDGIEKNLKDIQSVCNENFGAMCHVTVGRNDKDRNKGLLTEHSKEEYYNIWKTFKSQMFDFKMKVLGIKRKEFCYAGAWSLSINLYTGQAQPCYWQPYNQNVFEDINKPIKFMPVGKGCTLPYCYNAHAHMTWGVIPSLKTPCYCIMRNRTCSDGSEWLKENCKEFFQTKLEETNKKYTKFNEIFYQVRYPFIFLTWLCHDFTGVLIRGRKYINRHLRKQNEK